MDTRRETFIELPAAAPGTTRLLKIFDYGEPGARPKAWLQAALHADELPGMLVLWHLRRMLDSADAKGLIRGHIGMAPVANPVGLAQRSQDHLLGRLDLGNGRNFNRDHLALGEAAAVRLAGKLTDDLEANREIIRAALREAACAAPAADETAWLKRTLMERAVDADIVLDLHCDNEALLHLYTSSGCWPRAESLAAFLGCRGVFLAEVSGGDPFDEAITRPWIELARRFDNVPEAPVSATIELRGLADVDDATARADAEALYDYLVYEGVIDGDRKTPPAPACVATPLEGVEHLRTPVAGLVLHQVAVGERVARGDIVARIVDPLTSFGDGVTPLYAGTDGLVYSRTHHRIVAPGMVVTGIAGSAPVERAPGETLLTD